MAVELEKYYYIYRKSFGHIHLSRTGYMRTLCATKLDSENTVYGHNVNANCPICLEEYKLRTGKDADEKKPIENQLNLF